MLIPFIRPAPDPKTRAEMIAHSSDKGLEELHQLAVETLLRMSEAHGRDRPEYSEWNAFFAEIEAAQRKWWRGRPRG
jgi:hypothetical protein